MSPRWTRLLALALLITALGPTRLVADGEFQVEEVTTRLAGETFVLDADIDFDFSPQALEALDNGVPLTILLHVQVRPEGAWIWTDSEADLRLRYGIRYKPLSERYEVYRIPGGAGRSFVSREAAIAALGELRGVELVSQRTLAADTEYRVHLRAELDLEELPLPLRPIAYLRPAWKLGTGWTSWPLTP